ncbi:response regulator transcription factor (plasmid) [Aggregatilineales bacterium SYSU G02658]
MSKTQQVLIVEDERTIREVVRRYLEVDGFNVHEAEDGQQALHILTAKAIDLIILDIMIPKLDGFALARKLRTPSEYVSMATSGEVPIIFLTARKDEKDRLDGFAFGGDDYLTKPFSPRELLARVKAVLRRSTVGALGTEEPIQVDRLRLDPRSRSVTVDERTVTLTAKEFDLLWFLARHPHQVFSRSQLLDNVWGFEFYGDESTVTVHVRRLREKIEPDANKPTYIQTVWGIGYKFEIPE